MELKSYKIRSKNKLFDYEFQKKYAHDEDKWALYCAFAFTGARRVVVWAPDRNAVFAYIYSNFIHYLNCFRMNA